MWTEDGNAPGPAACDPGAAKTWQEALDYVARLNANAYLGHVDWRLPNRNELRSLVNYGDELGRLAERRDSPACRGSGTGPRRRTPTTTRPRMRGSWTWERSPLITKQGLPGVRAAALERVTKETAGRGR